LASIQPGDPVLDVCCGTGDLAFRLARAGAEVTALDFSEPMLKQALQRNGAFIRKPSFIQGDALSLPFPDKKFSVVTIGYGLRNLSDFSKGIQEMVRVAKPGGKVMILDFGAPVNHLWRDVYYCYLRIILPIYGWIFCRNAAAYSYILESLIHYPNAVQIGQLLKESGCKKVDIYYYLGGIMTIHKAILPE
jgi:demethylmenaquinone methyltransferase/2-methoxy-6-polyprenyl-1,4-benzoquinol methylase